MAIFPDHLEVTVAATLRLHVTLSEVGLSAAQSKNLRVGGAFLTLSTPAVWRSEWAA